jgi:outer membrane lipoprotein-sorting protein
MNGRMIFLAAALIAVLAAVFPAASLRPQATADLSGEEILARLDANEVSETRYVSFKMTINRGGGRRLKELTMQCWVQGRDRAAIEVTSGPDKGTRYLKLGADLWIASREAEKPMKISGHLLRQSMLDSDWSYEDTTDNRPLAERFTVKLGGTETRAGRTVWVLSLTAKSKDESYPLQTLWVDQQTFLPIRSELKALSGMLLKTLDFEDLQQVQDRWTPMKMTMRDALKKDSVTTVVILEIKFGIPIDPKIISLEFVENVH